MLMRTAHADENRMGSQRFGKGQARELGPLIGVEDCRLCPHQRVLKG
jgi:hypothetical protein